MKEATLRQSKGLTESFENLSAKELDTVTGSGILDDVATAGKLGRAGVYNRDTIRKELGLMPRSFSLSPCGVVLKLVKENVSVDATCGSYEPRELFRGDNINCEDEFGSGEIFCGTNIRPSGMLSCYCVCSFDGNKDTRVLSQAIVGAGSFVEVEQEMYRKAKFVSGRQIIKLIDKTYHRGGNDRDKAFLRDRGRNIFFICDSGYRIHWLSVEGYLPPNQATGMYLIKHGPLGSDSGVFQEEDWIFIPS